jgi:hypothetical protein
MQDSYEQQGSSFGINLGFGLKKPALNNASISMGIVDIYKETTKRSTGIIELATNDNNISEAESLINLLNSNSLHISGEIINNTVKEDMEYINADFEGKLEIPMQLFTKSGRAEMIDNLKNLDRNLGKTVDLTIGATARGVIGIGMSKDAFANYDKVIEEVKISQGYGNHQMDEIISHIEKNLDKYPNFDEFTHQKAAYKYGAYVDNPAIAALFRTAGEAGQFVYYSADDLTRRIVAGGEKQGMYQPYGLKSPGGIYDSMRDIENVAKGAQGQVFKPEDHD